MTTPPIPQDMRITLSILNPSACLDHLYRTDVFFIDCLLSPFAQAKDLVVDSAMKLLMDGLFFLVAGPCNH
jgi:hypothetical protein